MAADPVPLVECPSLWQRLFWGNSGKSKAKAAAAAVQRPKLGSREIYQATESLPLPRPGTKRIFRGTNTPESIQLSRAEREAMAKDPMRTPRSGENDFMGYSDADSHAFAGQTHPDAISVTTDLSIARGYGQQTILFYDVPIEVFERLPVGDPVLGEVVVKHSIPERWLRGVVVSPPKTPAP